MRNRVWYWHDCLEPEVTLLITMHHRALVWPFTARVLYIIKSFAVRLPDVDLDIVQWLSRGIFDSAEDEARLAVGVVRYLGPVRFGLCFVGMEGAEDCAFGALGRFGVVDAVDEEG